jgi:protein associated with RNAse G/E
MPIQRGAEPPVRQRRDFALLVPAEGDWTACFNADGELEIYADVTTRPVLSPGQVTAVDLDLDVVRYRDGRVAVLDEDEFAEHQVQLDYPAELIEQARTTCDWLVGAVSARREPFGQTGAAWLARAQPPG